MTNTRTGFSARTFWFIDVKRPASSINGNLEYLPGNNNYE